MADDDESVPGGKAGQPATAPPSFEPINPAAKAEVTLSGVGHEMMEEQKAKEKRRWEALQSDLHPDTGNRPRPGDERNTPLHGAPYPSAMDRIQRYVQEQQRRALYQHQQAQQQKLLDLAMGGSTARAIREHMDKFDQQRRYLDPLFDRDFVQRLTGGLDSDLMRRATELREPTALQSVREQVDSAVTRRITDLWNASFRLCTFRDALRIRR
jgi:hypothetical protein